MRGGHDPHVAGCRLYGEPGCCDGRVELPEGRAVATARAGDPCSVTGKPLEEKRGIEVGNIFQLGAKYSESMGFEFLDEAGASHPVIMGSYGIGVGSAMASAGK